MDNVSPLGHWLGLVVAKRHARRAVTRNLIRRQIRSTVGERLADLPSGQWLVRLRAPIDRKQFPSAASCALTTALRSELQALIARAVAPKPARGTP